VSIHAHPAHLRESHVGGVDGGALGGGGCPGGGGGDAGGEGGEGGGRGRSLHRAMVML
tara:strand:+ start:222 stop:395 length:174 start_codon:yes stop_codon:yes gene_type:complete